MVFVELLKQQIVRAKRARLRRALRRRRPGYHSAFGGLWTDRLDAERVLGEKERAGGIDPADAELLRSWMADGFVVLPSAVPADVVDAIDAEVDAIWERADASFRIEIGERRFALEPALRREPYKLLDLCARSQAALTAACAAPIQRFLRLVFEREPLLFQSLSFEWGSSQPIHQDSTYVVVSSPLELAAAWIALQDVSAGSGELEYYVGSHRLPDFVFPGGTRSYHPELHDDALHASYLDGLHARARAAGLERRSFTPRKGDVLIWSADLAHGGAAVLDPGRTRKSLVCHYCPLDVTPGFFFARATRRPVREFRGLRYCSTHHDVSPGLAGG